MTKYRSYPVLVSILSIFGSIHPPLHSILCVHGLPVSVNGLYLYRRSVSTSVVGSSLCSSFGYLSVLVLLLGTLFWTLGTMFFGSPPKNILIYCLCLSLLPAFGCSLVHCYIDIAHKRTCINHIETMTEFSVWHHLS